MTAAEFIEWQREMGWKAPETARRLGISVNTVYAYRSDGVPKRDEMRTRLACAALAARIKPWGAR